MREVARAVGYFLFLAACIAVVVLFAGVMG